MNIRVQCERTYQLYIEICMYKKKCVIISFLPLSFRLYVCNVFLKGWIQTNAKVVAILCNRYPFYLFHCCKC